MRQRPPINSNPNRSQLAGASYAEPVAGWRLHNPPSFDLRDAPRAEARQPRDFGVPIVRFDVKVPATGVRHALHQHAYFAGRRP